MGWVVLEALAPTVVDVCMCEYAHMYRMCVCVCLVLSNCIMFSKCKQLFPYILWCLASQSFGEITEICKMLGRHAVLLVTEWFYCYWVILFYSMGLFYMQIKKHGQCLSLIWLIHCVDVFNVFISSLYFSLLNYEWLHQHPGPVH